MYRQTNRRILLLNDVPTPGPGYLEHIHGILWSYLLHRRLVFLPYGGEDWNATTGQARMGFAHRGFEILGIHEHGDSHAQVLKHERALAVGDGNALRVLFYMWGYSLVALIQGKITDPESTTPYIGIGGGAVVAGPSIEPYASNWAGSQGTNLKSLNLVPFHVIVNYDPEKDNPSIEAFLRREGNERATVVAMRKGSAIHVFWVSNQRCSLELMGKGGAAVIKTTGITELKQGESFTLR